MIHFVFAVHRAIFIPIAPSMLARGSKLRSKLCKFSFITTKGVVAGPWEPCSGQPDDQADGKGSEDAGEVVREKVKKKSFWQKLLGKRSNKESGSS